MKRGLKISLSAFITAAAYAAMYFVLVVNASPEDQLGNFGLFIVSSSLCIIGVPAGAVLYRLLERFRVDERHRNLAMAAVAFVWGFLFGWITLFGMMIGIYLVEKERSSAGNMR
ncbi:MAG: hypothetical protein V1875_03870 [Candidatus Altiarchaeota archaeon]